MQSRGLELSRSRLSPKNVTVSRTNTDSSSCTHTILACEDSEVVSREQSLYISTQREHKLHIKSAWPPDGDITIEFTACMHACGGGGVSFMQQGVYLVRDPGGGRRSFTSQLSTLLLQSPFSTMSRIS